VKCIAGSVNGFVNPSFNYDANGNMTSGMGRTLIKYTSYNMPLKIEGKGHATQSGSYTYDYTYNADHERTKLVHSTLGTFIYLHPAGKGQLLYERETNASRIEHKYYINAGGATVAVHYARENPTPTESATATRYFHNDHLGSVTFISNESGEQSDRLAYEPFGKRREPIGTHDDNNNIFPLVTDRGFTSHEHLDEIALIHMNGRVYDPVLGRFVTADPFLQQPGNLQDYNRYSYVNNNPLMYTDPSGYLKLGKIFRIAVAIAVAYYTGFYDFGTAAAPSIGAFGATSSGLAGGLAALGNAVVAGAAFGGISSGSIEGALHGGLSAGLFWAAGSFVPGPAGSLSKVAAHAAVGCATSAGRGGKCGQGALSAGFAEFAGPIMGNWGSAAANAIKHAVLGGTASVLGGGKFENGATTAAFGYMFNRVLSSFASERDAQFGGLKEAHHQGAADDWEHDVLTVKGSDGRYENAGVNRCSQKSACAYSEAVSKAIAKGYDWTTITAYGHSHGSTLLPEYDQFSTDDIRTIRDFNFSQPYGLRGYMVSPQKNVWFYDPNNRKTHPSGIKIGTID